MVNMSWEPGYANIPVMHVFYDLCHREKKLTFQSLVYMFLIRTETIVLE